jgi:release factor glutamine methyltransferase
MKLKELYSWGSEKIKDSRISLWLLKEICGIEDTASFYLNLEKEITPHEFHLYKENINRWERGEPLAYIIRKTEFFGYPFFIEPGVFIPRLETEILVELFLSLYHKRKKEETTKPQEVRILELCCGSGVISCSIAIELKSEPIFIIATDICKKALDIAAKNIIYHQLQDKIKLIASDLFSALSKDKVYDFILVNPPYVGIKDEIASGVLKWEPHSAIFGGDDGTFFSSKILEEADYFLAKGGILIMEINPNSSFKLRKKIKKEVILKEDYGKKKRFLILRKAS